MSPLSKTTANKPEASFKLNVEIPHAAHEVFQNSSPTDLDARPAQKTLTPNVGAPGAKTDSSLQRANLQLYRKAGSAQARAPKLKLNTKMWNTLEWVATSALIFMVLFFIINLNAYGTLFIDKLNQIRGNVQTNQFIQKITHPAAVTQQPLPITSTPDQSKKQIPYLDMEIAPPDDRIIIPRINKNIPIVKVKDENLIKRDWGALEADIQQALQNGVVHYPGTANPGENGNVVITGHSSYFLSDPGRFKDVFALLQQVIIGDGIVVYHNQQKYFYQVYATEIVTPDKIDVLTSNGQSRLTLITCWPVGTSLKRLVVFAKPVQG